VAVAPPRATELLAGPTIDPASIQCPMDLQDSVPFVRRHTIGYMAEPEFGGFDENCVPLRDLQGRYGGVGLTYTPLTVAMYGLARYGDMLFGSTPAEIPEPCRDPAEAVTAQAEWLRGNALVRSYRGVEHWAFPYDFPNPQGELEAPWTSGYAQGVAAPLFIAAWCVSDDPRWLDAATKSLRNLVVPVDDGGVATWVTEEAAWFEESVTPGAHSSRSLNGQLATVAGVHAVAEWTGAPDVARLRDVGFAAVSREIETFDAGFISLYTKWAVDHPLIAPRLDYNRFHVSLLSWMHSVTGDPRALGMALRFARYDDPLRTLRTADGEDVDFTRHLVFDPPWSAPTPAVLEVDHALLPRVSGFVLWSERPGERPTDVELQLSMDGASWSSSRLPWDGDCNDFRGAVTPTWAKRARVVLHGPPSVGLRGFGLLRDRGHPTGVANWLIHGAYNRPAMAFTDEGWAYNRISSVVFDLDGAFDAGLRIELTGLRGEVLPTLARSDDSVDFEPLGAAPVRTGETVTWELPTVDFEYLRFVLDTPSAPAAEHRLFLGPPGP